MKKIIFISSILCFLAAHNVFAGGKDSTYYHKISSFLESSSKLYEESHSATVNNESVSLLNSFLLEYRIAKLNKQTPISLYYDKDVEKWLLFYLSKQKHLTAKVLSLTSYYFPLFEKELDKYELPLELKYIPVIESALNPLARSHSGAVGLWQFKYETAKLLGLKITSYVDERRAPLKSTEAACNYFKYLYSIFNDWLLTIAAYNAGPTTIKNAIIRAGGDKNWFAIKKYLSKETQNYVPKFVAINYIMNFYKDYGLNKKDSLFSYFQVDTIITDNAIRYNVVSKYTGVPTKILSFLNPQYKYNYKPITEKPAIFILPLDAIGKFVKNEKQIYFESSSNQQSQEIEKIKITHIVQKGEYLHLIAVKYHVPIQKIREWNNLKSDILHTNQKLILWVDKNITQTLK